MYRIFITFDFFASKGSVEFVACQALRLGVLMPEHDDAGKKDVDRVEDGKEPP
jgi:hypothetical protein